MSDLGFHIFVLVNRYLHVVCAALLLGGTLFYEMVVPIAISELKEEQQLLVFARARWVFRSIVWTACILLLLSGVISSYRNVSYYLGSERPHVRVPFTTSDRIEGPQSGWMQPGWWWAAHASAGTLAIVIAMSLTTWRRPPVHPIQWMRLNLVILLIVIFLASATRHVRRVNEEAAQDRYTGTFSPD